MMMIRISTSSVLTHNPSASGLRAGHIWRVSWRAPVHDIRGDEEQVQPIQESAHRHQIGE